MKIYKPLVTFLISAAIISAYACEVSVPYSISRNRVSRENASLCVTLDSVFFNDGYICSYVDLASEARGRNPEMECISNRLPDKIQSINLHIHRFASFDILGALLNTLGGNCRQNSGVEFRQN